MHDQVVIGLLIMSLYWGVGDSYTDTKSITNTSAVLFMWSAMPAFGAASYVPSLTLERKLFQRERNDGLYMVVTYTVYKLIEELLLAALASIGVAAFVFYGVKLQGSFGVFWIQYYLTLSVGIALAYFISAISPNLDVANALLPAYVVRTFRQTDSSQSEITTQMDCITKSVNCPGKRLSLNFHSKFTSPCLLSLSFSLLNHR